MATFYFNGAVDFFWTTLGNWWMDAIYSVPATRLPYSTDSVIANAVLFLNGSTPVVHFTLNGGFVYGDLTVTASATINNSAYIESATINGNVVLHDSAFNAGVINGNATFYDFSANQYNGTINGNAIFYDASQNNLYGNINGNATFYDNSYNANGGNINGNAVFRGKSYNQNGISGSVILSYEKGINGSSILGVL